MRHNDDLSELERAARALYWSRGGGIWSILPDIEKIGWIKSAECMFEEIGYPIEKVTIEQAKTRSWLKDAYSNTPKYKPSAHAKAAPKNEEL